MTAAHRVRCGSRQSGIILLAVMVLMMIVAAIALVSRANRLPSSATADTSARLQMSEFLNALKYQLVAQALSEDNTPGTMPCPNGAGSCSPDASSLVGDAIRGISTSDVARTSLPTPTPPGLCLQYVLAPSLRNSLSTSYRGTDAAQKRVNPEYDEELSFSDDSGVSKRAWAVLLANTGISACSLSGLGYQLVVNATTGQGTLSVANDASKTTTAVLIEKRDIISALMSQALLPLDHEEFKTYLATKTLVAGTRLSAIRAADAAQFDTSVAPFGTTFGAASSASSTSSSACPAVVVTSGSSSSSTSYKTPVSWLCFNDWYAYVTYDKEREAFTAFDTKFSSSSLSSTLTCVRKSGTTSCSY